MLLLLLSWITIYCVILWSLGGEKIKLFANIFVINVWTYDNALSLSIPFLTTYITLGWATTRSKCIKVKKVWEYNKNKIKEQHTEKNYAELLEKSI